MAKRTRSAQGATDGRSATDERARTQTGTPTGTGTRARLEESLSAAGIAPSSIAGFEREESTHLALAAALASGAADAGFGVQGAADNVMDFIPMVVEDYFPVCEKATLDSPQTGRLLAALRSEAWRSSVARLAGYDARDSGEITSLRRTLPWYRA